MLSSKNPFYLIVGQSHTEALQAALKSDQAPDLKILNYNRPSDPNQTRGKFLPSMVEGEKPTHLISMISGNYHNVFGLIEHPIPFNLLDARTDSVEVEETRVHIPYSMMYDHFSQHMRAGFLRTLLEIRDCFSVPTYHVCSPPPVADSQFIVDNPGGYFSDKVKEGVSPAHVRRILYDIHTTVFRLFCEENNIAFLPPPEGTVDENGFLAKPYWLKDPTHANALYGQKVLEQIRSLGGQ